MSFADPWPMLALVRRFSIRVAPAGGGPLVSHHGSGDIRVETAVSPETSTITWYQTGRWTAGPHSGVHFTNTTAWGRRPDRPSLALSHLRRGPDAPALLAILEPAHPGTWLAVEPHRCGPDIYRPTLEWDRDGLRLTWEVQSPTDPYTLYFEAKAEAA